MGQLWMEITVLSGSDFGGIQHAIRNLATKGRSPQQIFESVGARNLEQVQRVLQGKTYKRIQPSAEE